MIRVDEIIKLQTERTSQWHQQKPEVAEDGLLAHVEANHLHNFELWHHEDKARRDDKGFEYVYQAKRNIDHHNQQRNNCMEAIDAWIVQALEPKQTDCPVHSETPGMMIDRLSILALKEYHMREQAERVDATEDHKQQCMQKLSVIIAQKEQLSACLDELLSEIKNGSRTFVVYHQFKMYNDPKLNPQLYKNEKNVI